jgi:hypothetical protein
MVQVGGDLAEHAHLEPIQDEHEHDRQRHPAYAQRKPGLLLNQVLAGDKHQVSLRTRSSRRRQSFLRRR